MDQPTGKRSAWLSGLLVPGQDARQKIAAALPPSPPPGVIARPYQPPVAWTAAREALLQDADAKLPV
jgi:hypothetical protein